jgi:hypothetical protein
MQISSERKSARHILGKAVNREGELRLRRGIVIDVYVMLSLALKVGGKTQTAVAIGLGNKLASAASLGINARIRLADLEYSYRIILFLNELRVQSERLNSDSLLAVPEEYFGINVIMIKNRFHFMPPLRIYMNVI